MKIVFDNKEERIFYVKSISSHLCDIIRLRDELLQSYATSFYIDGDFERAEEIKKRINEYYEESKPWVAELKKHKDILFLKGTIEYIESELED